MENKKKLQINCAICDTRNITEEILSAYEAVQINAATLVTSPEAQALLGRYRVCVNTAGTAAISPSAVVPNAVANPGAITPIDTDWFTPIDAKESITPHMVPNKPTNGATYDTIDKNHRLRSNGRIIRSTDNSGSRSSILNAAARFCARHRRNFSIIIAQDIMLAATSSNDITSVIMSPAVNKDNNEKLFVIFLSFL